MPQKTSTMSRKKPTTSRKKPTTSRKKPTTSRKKPTASRKKPTSSGKKPTASRKKPTASRKKSTSGSNEAQFKNAWESKFTVQAGKPWRVYLFEVLPKNKFGWGLYGPSKEDFIQHMQLGARSRRQPLEFVHNINDANLIVVGDYSDNETRKVAKAQFPSFIISSVLALELLTEDQRDKITEGYQDRLKQEHAITYDRHGVHYH